MDIYIDICIIIKLGNLMKTIEAPQCTVGSV